MAKIIANLRVDSSSTNLNALNVFDDLLFYENIEIDGKIYPETVEYLYYNFDEASAAVYSGYGFSVEQIGNTYYVRSGVIQAIEEYYYDGINWTRQFIISDINVSAVQYYNAIVSPGVDDDYTILRQMLDSNDFFSGSVYDDVFFAYAGNDEVFGGLGDDELYGGSGVDIAVYSGPISDYVITSTGAGELEVFDTYIGEENEGLDNLYDFEYLSFDLIEFSVEEVFDKFYDIAPFLGDYVYSTDQNIYHAKAITASYEILLSGVPNAEGYSYLLNVGNYYNFGAGYGVDFNEENIYINIFNGLVQGNSVAKSTFDSIIFSGSLLSQIANVYEYIVPDSYQSYSGLAFFTRPEALIFYSEVAEERGISGENGAAIVAFGSMLKTIIGENIGIGNSVNDFIYAIGNNTSGIPISSVNLIALEVADGTAFDADDAVAMARIAIPIEHIETYASSSEVSESVFASSVSIVGYPDGHELSGSS